MRLVILFSAFIAFFGLVLGDPTILSNRYKLISQLGAGSYGTVYKAMDLSSGEMVAIKRSTADADSKRFTEEEAKMIQRAFCKSGGGVIEIKDHFECGTSEYCLVLELMNCDLYEITGHLTHTQPIIRLLQIQKMARDILPALKRMADQGIVHSDIKPENILHANSRNAYKLSDFGLAFDSTKKEQGLGGTLTYLSPETYVEGHTTVASEMWAFGLTLLNAFLGHHVFGQQHEDIFSIKQQLALKWEVLLGQIPDPLRYRLHNLGFVLQHYASPVPKIHDLMPRESGEHYMVFFDFADFIVRCLKYQPSDRLTAEKALEHPFVTDDIKLFATRNNENIPPQTRTGRKKLTDLFARFKARPASSNIGRQKNDPKQGR